MLKIDNCIKKVFITIISIGLMIGIVPTLAKENHFENPIHQFVYLIAPPCKEDWNLILVNPWNAIDKNSDIKLKAINYNNSNTHYVDERIANDLDKMMNDMKKEGLSPVICSSYRTYEKQKSLYNKKVNYYLNKGYSTKKSKQLAGEWVAKPGTSEHHTGLALDIVDSHYQLLDKNQEKTATQKWLMKNSYKYGFVLRYPEEKKTLTGINYEPWHYRYVGKTNAKKMYEDNLCLEEYLKTIENNQFYSFLNH